jgi:hypothetical protein
MESIRNVAHLVYDIADDSGTQTPMRKMKEVNNKKRKQRDRLYNLSLVDAAQSHERKTSRLSKTLDCKWALAAMSFW